MEETLYPYRKKKVYIRLSLIILSLIILLAALLSLQKNPVITIILFGVCALFVVLYSVYKIVNIRQIEYFIKWDEKGVYTKESFAFCAWKNIKSVTLKRYMGYQTLFFEIDEKLETKISAMNQGGKQFYCLPLADCTGKPSEIMEQLQSALNLK